MVGVQYTMSVLLCSHDGLHCALLGTELTVPGVPRWWSVVVGLVVVSSQPALHSPQSAPQPAGRKRGNPGSRRGGAETSVTTSGDCHARPVSQPASRIFQYSHLRSQANNTQYRPGVVEIKVCGWILHSTLHFRLSNKQ